MYNMDGSSPSGFTNSTFRGMDPYVYVPPSNSTNNTSPSNSTNNT
jgi:hypothetical protein